MSRERPAPEKVPPLILVVDDNEDARAMCSLTMALAGFRTAEAENGAVAVDRAFVLAPDAILLDHAMPVMDGREAARRLRADARTRDTPLVILTGFDATTVHGRALRAEGLCDAYLVKPCDAEELVATIAGALSGHRREPIARAHDAPRALDAVRPTNGAPVETASASLAHHPR